MQPTEQPTSIDINILNNYQFENSNSLDSWKKFRYNRKHNKILLGVRDGHLVEVQAKDVTIWQLFLRIFGKGKLAHTHVSLKSICNHLDKYNWKQFNNEQNANDGQNANFEAYKKVCTIAYKRLFYYEKTWIIIRALLRRPQILKNNSDYIQTYHGKFYLNPATTAKVFLRMLYINFYESGGYYDSLELRKINKETGKITTVGSHTPLRNKKEIEDENFTIY